MLDILKYTFFQNALIGSLIASVVCAMIGTYIVSRRLVFISGGLTHASFGGVGLGLYLGVSPIFAASLYTVLSAFGVEWLSKKGNVREDSAIAVFWAFGMAIGIMFTFLTPGYASDLSTYLFGNILTIGRADLYYMSVVTLAVLGFFYFFMDTIIAVAFDREYALSQRINVRLYEYILITFVALTIVCLLRMIGIVLVISMLTIPQMTANVITRKFKKIVYLSALIGFVSCLGGLVISYYNNVPSGASIIFVSIIIYVVVKLVYMFRHR